MAYTAATPPSTKSSCPATKLLSLDARKSTARATSFGSPAAQAERFYSAHLRQLAQTSLARDVDLAPGAAVRAYLEELASNTSIYQSLAASIGTVIQCGTPGCNAITAEGQRLLQRGQEAGAIRSDVTYDDLIYVVTAISIAIDADRSTTSRIGHMVDLFLNGISVKDPD